MKKMWLVVAIIGALELFVAGILIGKSTLLFPAKDSSYPASPTMYPSPTPDKSQDVDAIYPSQVLDLTNWKITLPIASSKNKTSPQEIKQPQLATYKIAPWFIPSTDGGVIFRAPVNGVTTSGSKYERSELREMTAKGTVQASWASTVGVHTMFIDEAITHVPTFKKHIVAGQIHDDQDDIVVIRLEYPYLYVNVGGENVATLDKNYTFGKRFKVKFVVSGGKTSIYYNDNPKPSYTFSKIYTNSYFKAGAYTQSNCEREKDPALCNANNYGEVVIYDVWVTHK